jgi:hypothetical protein
MGCTLCHFSHRYAAHEPSVALQLLVSLLVDGRPFILSSVGTFSPLARVKTAIERRLHQTNHVWLHVVPPRGPRLCIVLLYRFPFRCPRREQALED